MKEYGVKLIALRSAGFNNVDLKAALNNISVVRVPAYSPMPSRSTVALMLTSPEGTGLTSARAIPISPEGLLGFDMYGKTPGWTHGRIGRSVGIYADS